MYCFIILTGGFLMNKGLTMPDVRSVLTGCAAWGLCSLMLSLSAALLMTLVDIPAGAVGYICSSLSFASALFAGMRAMRGKERGALVLGLAVGTAVTIIALTLGFLISENALDADGVLSVVTFTLSGALAGALLSPKGKKRRKRKHVLARRRA